MVRRSKATEVGQCDDQIMQTTALRRHALARNTSNAEVMNVTRRACTVDACRSYDTRPRMCKRYHAPRNCKQIMQATSLQRATQQLASKTKVRATGPLHCLLKVFWYRPQGRTDGYNVNDMDMSDEQVLEDQVGPSKDQGAGLI